MLLAMESQTVELLYPKSFKFKKHRRGKKRMRNTPYEKNPPESVPDVELGSESATVAINDGRNAQTDVHVSALRLRYSPQAPRNYTQYIIQDQGTSNDLDIDLGKEGDFDSFLTEQFELDFKIARDADLYDRTTDELQLMLSGLEDEVVGLEQQLNSCERCSLPSISYDSNYNQRSEIDTETCESESVEHDCHSIQAEVLPPHSDLDCTTA